MSKKIVAIDSQRLEAMQYCPCFYNYKFNKNLVLINTPIYLERGSLIHTMLASYYQAKKDGVEQDAITAGRKAGLEMQLDIAEVEYTIGIFQQYTDLWENDSWNNIVAVEQVASKVLYDSPDLLILYEGKMDLVLQIGPSHISVDHKHSQSRRDPNQLSNQFKGYCFLLGTNNHIVNEIGFQKTVKPVEKFRRHLLSFSDAIIQEWIANSIYTIKTALAWEENNYYPRNFSSCDKYSGCDFKHVCASEPGDMREFKLRRDFKERVWDISAKEVKNAS